MKDIERLPSASVISLPEKWGEIAGVLDKKEIIFTNPTVDHSVDFSKEIKGFRNIKIGYIIIDLDSILDLSNFAFEMKNFLHFGKDKNTKIILITSHGEAESVVKTIKKCVLLGIHSIVDINEGESLSEKLNKALEEEPEFKDYVKWCNIGDEEEEEPVKKASKETVIEKSIVIEKERIIGTIIINLVGASKRVGTTHTAISMASYLASEGFKVAVVEDNTSNTFNKIKAQYEDITIERDYFKLNQIDFYSNASIASLSIKGYQYIIVDTGYYQENDLLEFMRSHKRLIVTTSQDWENAYLEEFLKDRVDIIKECEYLFNLCSNETFKECEENMMDLKCYQMPYNPAIFKISDKSFYKDLLKDILPKSNSTQPFDKKEFNINNIKNLVNKFKK